MKSNTTGLPDPNDYVLGRGRLYMAVLNTSTGKPDAAGWRDLGNAPAVNLNVTEETLEHRSSRAGTGTVDKQVSISRTATLTWSLDEISQENMALLLGGSINTYTNPAVAGITERELTSAVTLGRHYDLETSLGARAMGIHAANLTVEMQSKLIMTAAGGRTLTFATAGDTITASSGDFEADGLRIGHTITVAGTASNNGTLTITNLSATVITVAENLTDEGPLNATATITRDDFALVVNEDYTVDEVWGRVMFLSTSTRMIEGEAADFTLAADAGAPTPISEIQGLQNTNQRVALKFVSVNPANNDEEGEVEFHQLIPKADGDAALIGEDWTTLNFTATLEANTVGYPNSPYMTTKTHSES